MSKSCPECQTVVKARKKGRCPFCTTSLVLFDGVYISQDIEAITQIGLEKLRFQLFQYHRLVVDPTLDKAEKRITVTLLNQIKTVYSEQKKLSSWEISFEDFAVGFFDFVLSHEWYKEKIKSWGILKNGLQKLLGEYIILLKEKHKLSTYDAITKIDLFGETDG